MKKQNKHSQLISVLAIAIGISFAISYGYYNKAMAKEQITTSVSIHSESPQPLKPIIFDVADEGVVKKLLQPNYLIGRYQIKNDGKEPLTIKVDAVNFVSPVVVESGAPGLQKPSSEYVKTLNPGKSIRLKIRINLATTNFNQSKQSLGILRVLNQQTGEVIGIVPVYGVDSTVAAPLEKTSATPTQSHEDHKKNE